MRVVVPDNTRDSTSLRLFCQQLSLEFFYCKPVEFFSSEPVELFDVYRLGDEVVYKQKGEVLEQEYAIKGFIHTGTGHPQWLI